MSRNNFLNGCKNDEFARRALGIGGSLRGFRKVGNEQVMFEGNFYSVNSVVIISLRHKKNLKTFSIKLLYNSLLLTGSCVSK